MTDIKILIVDDEAPIRQAFGDILRDEGFSVQEADGWRAAEQTARDTHFDLFLLDFKMPEVNGIELMKRLHRITPSAEAMIITGYGTIEQGVEAIKQGARDYVTKPLESYELVHKVNTLLERRRLRFSLKQKDTELKGKFGLNRIIGVSDSMDNVRDLASRAAGVNSNVLIYGESGTGKELVARAIHYASPRSAGPFLAVNCGAIASGIAEREIFGHEKNSFTGAGEGGIGYFEAADGGTLFLDEIGEMSPDLQVKLLRVLDNQEITRVGSIRPTSVDVRVLFATNRDLEEMVGEGSFRQDLYYRINVIKVEIPPLRERQEDIPLLAAEFTRKATERLKLQPKALSEEAIIALESYEWPGNVRELENAIERAVALSRNENIELEDIPGGIFLSDAPIREGTRQVDFMAARRQAQERFDKDFITRALARRDGNVSQAAKDIGLARSVLQRFMRKYNIDRKNFVNS